MSSVFKKINAGLELAKPSASRAYANRQQKTGRYETPEGLRISTPHAFGVSISYRTVELPGTKKPQPPKETFRTFATQFIKQASTLSASDSSAWLTTPGKGKTPQVFDPGSVFGDLRKKTKPRTSKVVEKAEKQKAKLERELRRLKSPEELLKKERRPRSITDPKQSPEQRRLIKMIKQIEKDRNRIAKLVETQMNKIEDLGKRAYEFLKQSKNKKTGQWYSYAFRWYEYIRKFQQLEREFKVLVVETNSKTLSEYFERTSQKILDIYRKALGKLIAYRKHIESITNAENGAPLLFCPYLRFTEHTCEGVALIFEGYVLEAVKDLTKLKKTFLNTTLVARRRALGKLEEEEKKQAEHIRQREKEWEARTLKRLQKEQDQKRSEIIRKIKAITGTGWDMNDPDAVDF